MCFAACHACSVTVLHSSAGYSIGGLRSLYEGLLVLAVLQLSPNMPWIGHCKPARSRVQYRCLLAGPQLDLPHDVTPKQLETLLNGLLKQEDKLPYSFFVNEQQLAQELGSHLLQHKV